MTKKQAMMLQGLAELAARYAGQGSGYFYGCARCRWSRTGCISWNCNPDKYQAHRLKFPEKYKDKDLKEGIEAKMSWEELTGLHSPIAPPAGE